MENNCQSPVVNLTTAQLNYRYHSKMSSKKDLIIHNINITFKLHMNIQTYS